MTPWEILLTGPADFRSCSCRSVPGAVRYDALLRPPPRFACWSFAYVMEAAYDYYNMNTCLSCFQAPLSFY